MAPYRIADPPPPSADPIPNDRASLGAVRSTHHRSGLGATLGRDLVLAIHVDGIFIDDGAIELVIRFEDIDALYFAFDQLLGTLPTVTLTTFGGVRWALPSDVTDIEIVLGVLKRQVTLPMGRDAEEAFLRGTRLDFGPVVLHPNGIALAGAPFVAWSDLTEVHLDRQTLVIHAKLHGRVGWARLDEIPHPGILLDLLRRRASALAVPEELKRHF